MKKIIIGLAAVLAPVAASAQTANPATVTPFSLTSSTYTQNFNTLANSGSTGTVLPTGFQIVENGTNANGTYGVDDGSTTTGGSYSFGTTGSTDRALGSIGSGSLTPIYYGAVFTNGTASTITSLTFSYTGEQWRLGNSTDDGLTFQYQMSGTGVGGTSNWTTVADLAFAPPQLFTTGMTQGALDGNAIANRTSITGTINGLSLIAGQNFAFRWVDVNSAANDDALAVDDLSITATTAATSPVPEPASWAMMIVGAGLVGGAMRRRSRSTRVAFGA